MSVIKDSVFYGRALLSNLRYWSAGSWRRTQPQPRWPGRVPPDFFGICVASAADAATDDYVIARLRELALEHLRLDFSYVSRGGAAERFLKRLLDESFRVCLHLVPPAEEVRAWPDPQALERWRDFVAQTLAAYGSRLELVEIGATVNRRRWSGYAPSTFFLGWQIAWQEARRLGVRLAGPNVTDFEPFYNIAILDELRRRGQLPDLHSDNLFVERAGEPEAFDHKILGRRLAGLVSCNLLRKAQLLQDIGAWAGAPEMICSHVAWSLRRIARQQADIEEKQADYLARYACLAAAAGALRRVYWGPLIGQREGLIDDGTAIYPEIPQVTFYANLPGRLEEYRPRPAFAAIQTATRFLSGTFFQRRRVSVAGLEILEFSDVPSLQGRPGRSMHVIWTRDAQGIEAAACYPPATLSTAEIYSRAGVKLAQPPALFTESPLYLIFDAALPSAGLGLPIALQPAAPALSAARFAAQPATSYAPLSGPGLVGFYLAESAGHKIELAALLDLALAAEQAQAAPPAATTILRDSRNRVWSVALSGAGRGRRAVVKQFKPRCFIRRLLQQHKPNRALRSWNSAQELLRRGIATPAPLAVLYAPIRSSAANSYYICRAFENSWSVREAFNAFSAGATQFQGKATMEFYKALARFLKTMHDRGAFHRDLSAGNLLFQSAPESELEFALIDTARARFYPRPLGLRQRLCDLIRLCHPLYWPGRRIFVTTYLQLLGRSFRIWLKTPFVYYDLKHWLKRAFKKLRRRR